VGITPLRYVGSEVAFKCTETCTASTVQSAHGLNRISADTGFWTCVDWKFFAQLNEYYNPLDLVTPFLNTLYNVRY
jgi:hypothetical protein